MDASRYLYITKKQYQDLLEDLNIDQSESGGLSPRQQNDLLDEAVGELEGDLVERFTVPLQAANKRPYETAPSYARQKVLSCLKAKIRELIGHNKMKNIVIDSTDKFIDLKHKKYTTQIKALLDPKRDMGLNLQEYAGDGALQPVQKVGVARTDDTRMIELNNEDLLI